MRWGGMYRQLVWLLPTIALRSLPLDRRIVVSYGYVCSYQYNAHRVGLIMVFMVFMVFMVIMVFVDAVLE